MKLGGSSYQFDDADSRLATDSPPMQLIASESIYNVDIVSVDK